MKAQAAYAMSSLRMKTIDRVATRKDGGAGMAAVEAARSEIRAMDQFDIVKVGKDDQTTMRDQGQIMLAGTKNNQLGEAGQLIDNVVAKMQGFDMELHYSKVEAVAGGLFKKGRSAVEAINETKEAFKAAFKQWQISGQETNKTLTTMSDKVEEHATTLASGIAELNVAWDACYQGLQKTEVSIAALSLEHKELCTKTIPALEAQLAADAGNAGLTALLNDARGKRDAIDRRCGNLADSYVAIATSLQKIRIMQQSSNGLIEGLNTVQTTMIGQWYMGFALAKNQYEQQLAGNAIKDMRDFDKKFREQQAKLMGENALAAQDAAENGIMDAKSLIDEQQKLGELIQELVKRQTAFADARREAEDAMLQSTEQLSHFIANPNEAGKTK